ncbi:PE-PPE domain-containing protein [Mycobacterium sp.]|uniref:PE-PPE domain-containing protein n=1 Tax=Mycobacterium sp. TaxID=1785 RepID=UPI003D11ACE8
MPDHSIGRLHITSAVAIAGAGLITVAPLHPPTDVQVRAIQLTSVDNADSSLGDGTALIVGGSGYPTPGQGYADAYDALYLHNFPGTLQSLTTPESLYPFTLPFSETLDASAAQGAQDIVKAVDHLIAAGGVDAADPVVVTGYSQGALDDSLAMSLLTKQLVPSDDVHFVSLGDPSAPNGGLLERFDLPAGTNPEAPSLGLTFSGATPSDLYPTDIYTYEYDGFADFPKYPINIVSDLNAYLGILFNHVGYLGLTPEQVTPVADGGDAIQLPTSAADTLTDYYLIPSDSLPLLDPLRLVPFVGNPLADLLQPDLKVLVNLGYGSIDNGFSPGYADVPTTLGFLPPQSVLDQVPQALMNGLQQGLQDAYRDLTTSSNYQLVSPETTAAVGPLLGTITAGGDLNDPSDLPNLISAELNGIENWFTQGVTELSSTHTGIPLIDMASTVLFTLPQIAENIFETEMAAGDPLDAIGDPIALTVGIAPLVLIGAIF